MAPTITANRLTTEEKRALAEQYAPLVKHVASRLAVYLPPFLDKQDLINDGVVGLMDSLDRFDPTKGIKFQTFAAQRIRGAILDALRTHDWVGRGARQRARDVKLAEEKLSQTLGRAPSAQEVCDQVGIAPTELMRRRREESQGQVFSLDEIRSLSDGAGETRASTLVDPHACVESQANHTFRREVLLQGLKHLSTREQTVLSLYYFEELNVREIAQVLGVSEPRVSQLHTRSLKKLKEHLAVHRYELVS